MARVVCPAPGCQLTLMDVTAPVWIPQPSYVIVDGPHRIITSNGYRLGEPIEAVITEVADRRSAT